MQFNDDITTLSKMYPADGNDGNPEKG